jgi:hypothetical protein
LGCEGGGDESDCDGCRSETGSKMHEAGSREM